MASAHPLGTTFTGHYFLWRMCTACVSDKAGILSYLTVTCNFNVICLRLFLAASRRRVKDASRTQQDALRTWQDVRGVLWETERPSMTAVAASGDRMICDSNVNPTALTINICLTNQRSLLFHCRLLYTLYFDIFCISWLGQQLTLAVVNMYTGLIAIATNDVDQDTDPTGGTGEMHP